MIAAALRVAGLRTGLYTSPHLIDPRERIQIDGAPVSERVWVQAFEAVHSAAETLLAREEIDAHPSFFETVTAMAFVAFAREGVEGFARNGTRRPPRRHQCRHPGGCRDHAHRLRPRGLSRLQHRIHCSRKSGYPQGRAVPPCFPSSVRKPSRCWIAARSELDVPVTLSSHWRVENARVENSAAASRWWRTRRFRFAARWPGSTRLKTHEPPWRR